MALVIYMEGAEKPKSRKLVPNYLQDQKWRNKVKLNAASKRYERTAVLSRYSASEAFPIPVPEDILPLFEACSLAPALALDRFSHSLGENVGSRKFVQREKKLEKTPEWFESPSEGKRIEREGEIRKEEEEEGKRVCEKVEEELEVGEVRKSKENEESEMWGEMREEEGVVVEKNNGMQAKEAGKNKSEGNEKKGKKKEEKIVRKEVEQGKNNVEPAEKLLAKPQETQKLSVKPKEAQKSVIKPQDAQKSPIKPQEAQKTPIKPQEDKKIEGKKQTNGKVSANPLTSQQNTKIKQESIVEEEKNEEERRLIVPAYEKGLLMFFFNKGNPFAKAMIQNGIDSPDDKIYFPLGSKPYEKVWFYRDPEGSIQGPFSCIEMFNWTIRKCFPENLEISFCNTEFVPMNSYFTNLEKTASESIIQTVKEEPRSEVQETKDGTPKKPWGNVDKPIGSLKDIQQDQFIRKN